jgi:hypothetical protein
VKYSPISISTYFLFPLSSLLRFIVAWAVVPDPPKKSKTIFLVFKNKGANVIESKIFV